MKSSLFKLPNGKYKGKTLEWVEKYDKDYLEWAKENAPGLITPPKEKIAPTPIRTEVIDLRDRPQEAIQPNTNFYNEGPAQISIPYLNKIKSQE